MADSIKTSFSQQSIVSTPEPSPECRHLGALLLCGGLYVRAEGIDIQI